MNFLNLYFGLLLTLTPHQQELLIHSQTHGWKPRLGDYTDCRRLGIPVPEPALATVTLGDGWRP